LVGYLLGKAPTFTSGLFFSLFAPFIFFMLKFVVNGFLMRGKQYFGINIV